MRRFYAFYHRQDAVTFWATSFSIIVSLIIISLLLIPDLPSQLPLFYSQPWGDNQLAAKSSFILLPAIIILTVLINTIIAWHLHYSQTVLKRMLFLMSALVSLLILITTLKIIFIFI